jgi:hypothetical protein
LEFRGCYGGVSMSAGETSDSAVIDSRYKTARQRDSFGGSTSGLTRFSAAPAAFLLDAMAAAPRKWVSDGAPTLPCVHERADARLLWRRLYERRGVLRFGSHRQPLQNRAKARSRREAFVLLQKSRSKRHFAMRFQLAMRVWKRALRISCCAPTGIPPNSG